MTTATHIVWRNFLQNQEIQAPIQDQLLNAAEGNIVVDFSHRGLLKLSGEDAFSFLQGQVTNDVNLLDGAHSQFAGYCNPKGRLLALFFAFSINGEIYLSFDQGLLETIMKRLKMFVMRSKVVISDVNDLVLIGVAGKKAQTNLSAIFSSIPENAHEVIQHAETTLIRLPSTTTMFELVTTQEKAIDIWQKITTTHSPASKTAWDWLEIQAGIPEIVAKTQEAFVPQMINLDALGGINFKKGCYTGQEIVARTHYLGKIKRRTQLAHIASETPPNAGDEITDSAQQVVGQIVRASPARFSGFDVLAECRLENLAQSQLFWQTHALNIKPLPYTL